MTYEADYVVVGAGAAGSVVAARLAEDGTRSVIVVEAGPDNTADPTIAAAARFPFLLDMPAAVGPHPSPSHWGFVSKQNGKEYCYPRGTGLGGSTNHHATVDGRGSPLIYDEWARQTGDDRWSYRAAARRLQEDGELRRAVRRRNGTRQDRLATHQARQTGKGLPPRSAAGRDAGARDAVQARLLQRPEELCGHRLVRHAGAQRRPSLECRRRSAPADAGENAGRMAGTICRF